MKNNLKPINMTEEEIKIKAKEIAQNNGRIYRDQEYGDIDTEEECYDSAIKMAEWVITEMKEKYINVPSAACILSDESGDKLVVTTDLSALKRYKSIKNNIKNSSDIALIQQAVDKARDLANTLEGALAGEEPYLDTYYRMCQDIIECLTKINKIV